MYLFYATFLYVKPLHDVSGILRYICCKRRVVFQYTSHDVFFQYTFLCEICKATVTVILDFTSHITDYINNRYKSRTKTILEFFWIMISSIMTVNFSHLNTRITTIFFSTGYGLATIVFECFCQYDLTTCFISFVFIMSI